MSKFYYTDEKNIQLVIALLKEYKIKKIIASPGTTNVGFIGSIQNDPYFEIYSSVDERSAAYLACGLAVESGEPVVLSCTGATASRNYIPALTEAFYRKIPILALTSALHIGNIGHNIPQIIDRRVQLNDMVKMSIHLPTIHTYEDLWAAEIDLNKALLELTSKDSGPIHINLVTTYSTNFNVKSLPKFRKINKIKVGDNFPEIKGKKIGIFVGAHKKWDTLLTKCVESFCEKYNGVVFCDGTSNYEGKYRIDASLICSQEGISSLFKDLEIMIHIGDISGAYLNITAKEFWRVNLDGQLRDTYKKLKFVFEMEEIEFFKMYLMKKENKDTNISYYIECKKEYDQLYNKLSNKDTEIPFSNIWIAKESCNILPHNSCIHFGILNSLRAWNLFEKPSQILGYSNTGGFGIDGILSTMIGASFFRKDKIYFAILGDLAFFYDINVLGNKHLNNNIRILLVNNGKGTEFRNYNHGGAIFGEEADKFIAAGGHFGNKSPKLVKNFVETLGFEYLSATTKEEYLERYEYFFSKEELDKPIVFEVFTNSKDESDALKIVKNLKSSPKGKIKKIIKVLVNKNTLSKVKKIIKKG